MTNKRKQNLTIKIKPATKSRSAIILVNNQKLVKYEDTNVVPVDMVFDRDVRDFEEAEDFYIVKDSSRIEPIFNQNYHITINFRELNKIQLMAYMVEAPKLVTQKSLGKEFFESYKSVFNSNGQLFNECGFNSLPALSMIHLNKQAASSQLFFMGEIREALIGEISANVSHLIETLEQQTINLINQGTKNKPSVHRVQPVQSRKELNGAKK